MKLPLTVYCFVLFLFISSTVNAERGIAKCVDEKGDLTYTDFLCSTAEQGNNPLLMNEQAVDSSIHQKNSDRINAKSIAAIQLQTVTDQAIERCVKRFDSYFKRKFPATAAVSSLQFHEITDQYKKGSNVSISVIGSLEYIDVADLKKANVECTVQKFSEGDNWVVGFVRK